MPFLPRAFHSRWTDCAPGVLINDYILSAADLKWEDGAANVSYAALGYASVRFGEHARRRNGNLNGGLQNSAADDNRIIHVPYFIHQFRWEFVIICITLFSTQVGGDTQQLRVEF